MKKNLIAFVMVCSFICIFSQSVLAADALFVDENGKVGIGTSEPLYKLQLQADSEPWLYGGLYFEPIASDLIGFNYLGGNGGYGLSLYGTGASSSYANAQINLGSDGVINFLTGGGSESPTSKLYLAFNGNVGIGTSSPEYGFEVYEDNTDIAIKAVNSQPTSSNYAVYAKAYSEEGVARGVFGRVDGNANYNYGVQGYTFVEGGYSNYGLVGMAQGSGSSGRGVGGYVNGDYMYAYGIQTNVNSSGYINYGIYSSASGATYNLAGWFDGDVYVTGNVSMLSFTDRTPFYEGDALSEIKKISGKNGEIDHSTLPDFAHVQQEVPVFEETELMEISSGEAFETVKTERVKEYISKNEKGEEVKNKIRKGFEKVSNGYHVENGKIIKTIENKPIYETEIVETKRLKKNVYFNEANGKTYRKVGDGEIFEKDGKIYQNNQTGIKIEEQRDIGAMVSILTVAVQQLNEENEELQEQNNMLQERLSEIEQMLSSTRSKMK